MRLRLLLAVVLLIVAACVPEARPTSTPEDSPTSPAASPSDVATETPSESASADPTDEPVETPSASPSEEPSEETPSESAGEGAAACSGSEQNRDFFEDAASVLDWTVYCAVLPTGWFVNSGEYRRASGGRLEIAYRGPGGARLELHEGAYCAAGDGCVPSGTETGDATFGDKAGTLFATDSGGWALIVDGNSQISWLAVGTGLDEDGFRALTAALTAVSG